MADDHAALAVAGDVEGSQPAANALITGRDTVLGTHRPLSTFATTISALVGLHFYLRS